MGLVDYFFLAMTLKHMYPSFSQRTDQPLKNVLLLGTVQQGSAQITGSPQGLGQYLRCMGNHMVYMTHTSFSFAPIRFYKIAPIRLLDRKPLTASISQFP